MTIIKTAKELIESDIPDIKWIVKDIIPIQGVTILAGEAGSFKSYFSKYVSICCTNNITVLNTFETKKIKVLYLDEENGAITLKTRLKKLKDGMSLNIENFENLTFVMESNLKLFPSKEVIESLEEYIKTQEPDLIIVDSMSRFMVGDENQAKDVKLIYDTIKPLITKYNTSWLIIHHTRKGSGKKGKDDLRGSSDFVGFCDTVMMLNKKGKEFVLRQVKNRHKPEIDAIRFRVIDTENEDTENEGINLEVLGTVKDDVERAYEIAAENIKTWLDAEKVTKFRTKQVMEQFENEHSKSAVRKALNILESLGFIKKLYKGHWEIKVKNV